MMCRAWGLLLLLVGLVCPHALQASVRGCNRLMLLLWRTHPRTRPTKTSSLRLTNSGG